MTGNQTHVSSVAPLLRDLYPEPFTNLKLCLLCRHQSESVAATLRRHVQERLGRDLQLGQLRHQRLGGQPDRRLSRVQLQPPIADPRLELHFAGNGRQDHRGHRQEQDS